MSNFYVGLAEIFEVDSASISPEFSLVDNNWDSLAIVSTIALIDECFGVMIDGKILGGCQKVADIEHLLKEAKAP